MQRLETRDTFSPKLTIKYVWTILALIDSLALLTAFKQDAVSGMSTDTRGQRRHAPSFGPFQSRETPVHTSLLHLSD